MELLAQNFHEALNLTPLFNHLRREIVPAPLGPRDRAEFMERLSDWPAR